MNLDLDCGPGAHLDHLLAAVVVVGLGHVVVDGHQEEAVVLLLLLAPGWRAAASSGAGSVAVCSYHSFWRVWELEIIRH